MGEIRRREERKEREKERKEERREGEREKRRRGKTEFCSLPPFPNKYSRSCSSTQQEPQRGPSARTPALSFLSSDLHLLLPCERLDSERCAESCPPPQRTCVCGVCVWCVYMCAYMCVWECMCVCVFGALKGSMHLSSE